MVESGSCTCPRTVRKWLKRYREEGPSGLLDRSSRPHRLRQPLAAAIVERVVELRHRRWTGKQIAAELAISPASVSRVLKRRGLSRWRDLQPAPPVRRYQRANPGELIHLDIKKLGRFDRIGHRITGDRTRQSNQRGGRNKSPGWECVHVCIDDASRIAFSQIYPDEKAPSAVTFLNAAVAYYASLGVTVARVMTDNGSCYKAFAFRDACRISASGTSEPGPTHPKPTARPSASSRPRCASGPTLRPTQPQTTAPPNCHTGCTDTTGIDPTAAYNPNHPSAASALPRTTC